MKKEIIAKVNLGKEVLEFTYGNAYSEWNGKYHDDRLLFCNIYRILLEAYDAMATVENNYIWCAFNHKMEADEKYLKRILKNFNHK